MAWFKLLVPGQLGCTRQTTLTTMAATVFTCLMILSAVPTRATHYGEPIDVENLREFLEGKLDEDFCMPGILSVSPDGDPIIYTVSSTFTEEIQAPLETQTDSQEKTPMSLINELGQFNEIQLEYRLIEERGPAHKKQFLVSLQLGDEQYKAEGSSLKRAQHEAARLALNSTAYAHPPHKPKVEKNVFGKETSVHKLNQWARNHGDELITYTFDHSGHSNVYHSDMYSKETNVHHVTVTVAGHQFLGVGSTLDEAKENAAENALIDLRIKDGFCIFSNEERNILTVLFNSYDSNPISVVHEFSSKSKMPASFDLVREEGPAHIKSFMFKCSIGDKFETFGEGSNKKEAKRISAEKMVEQLKSEALYRGIECGEVFKEVKNSRKKKSSSLIKSHVKIYTEEEDFVYLDSDNVNPVSRLNEIQQKKHGDLPTFKLLENDKNNKDFYIEASVDDLTFIGSGKNKKTAKQNAAQGLLNKMGYSSSSTIRNKLALEDKNSKFYEDDLYPQKKNIAPGLNLHSDSFNDEEETSLPVTDKTETEDSMRTKDSTPVSQQDMKNKDVKTSDTSYKKMNSNVENKKQIDNPQNQLKKLAQQLGIKFQFSDFPNKKGGFITLLTLTTKPPKLCEGVGETVEQSQQKATLGALASLYKTELEAISRLLQHSKPDNDLEQPMVKPDQQLLIDEDIK